jgi:hypothetical protein
MHQAHQTAPARTARVHEAAKHPGPRSAAALARAPATAESWRMAILVLDPVPSSIKTARDFTTQTLGDWGLRWLSQDATLVVSELVTNALRHGGGDGAGEAGRDRPELILWERPGYLVCVVIDSSASLPVQVMAGVARGDGRGLQVVQALASKWGWTMLGVHRKAVWAVLRGTGTGSQAGTATAAAGPA